MADFMTAHGSTPGPGQHPVIAGVAAGVPAGAIVALILWASRSVLHRFDGHDGLAVTAAAIGLVALGGAYGLVFRRAANDARGGWLFGIGFGFVAWMCSVGTLGAIRGPVFVGHDAIMVMLAFLAYGTLLGTLFPPVHRLFIARIESQAPSRPAHR